MKKVFTATALSLISILTIKAQVWHYIPDQNFVNWLNNNGFSSAMNGSLLNDTMPVVLYTTSINCSNSNISTLEGIQYFTNLQSLNCRFNSLTTLPTLPQTLRYIHCESNNITYLPPLPQSLIGLNCDSNQLSTIPTLPNTIQWIDADNNQLASLPALPNGLDTLFISYNQLSNLPQLPNSLKHLGCSVNNITSLPNVPTSMVYLWCNSNQISTMPSVSNSLISLRCAYNQLTSLPDLSQATQLDTLVCYNNQLTALPPLPEKLKVLACESNNISGAIELPDSLEYLSCQWNYTLDSILNIPEKLKYLDCSNTIIDQFMPEFPSTLKDINISNTFIRGLTNLPDTLNSFIADWTSFCHFPEFSVFTGDTSDFSLSQSNVQCKTFNFQHTGFIPDFDNLPDCNYTEHIPDDNFVQYLLNMGLCGCLNGNMLDPSLPGVTNLQGIACDNYEIEDLTGLEHFVNINELVCNNNLLTELPPLPPLLTLIWCNNNQITQLPELPLGVYELDCSNNQLSSLPDLPYELRDLDCSNNNLTQLPPLLNSLEYLNCTNNLLSELPALPNNIYSITCDSNQIATFPAIPESVYILDCSHNNIEELPTLPANLGYLNCSYNSIDSLPSLPNNLYQFLVNDNIEIDSMPILQSFTGGENDFSVANTQITCFTNNILHGGYIAAIDTMPICGDTLTVTAYRTPVFFYGPQVEYTPPVGYIARIAADSSEVARFKITGEGAQDYELVIEEDPNASNPSQYGKLNIIYTSSDSVVYKYKSPYFIGENAGFERIVHLQLINSENSNVEETYSLSIVRPPVLMLHGLTSYGHIYFEMRNNLINTGKYHGYQFSMPDYPNTDGFSSNIPQIIIRKNHLFEQCLSNGVIAGKADFVGHSMGGILSRLYLQSTYYNNDMYRLITLNSPHSGSQGANLIKELTSPLNPLNLNVILNPVLQALKFKTNGQAWDDLRVNSNATDVTLNGVANLNRNQVPTVAIATTYNIIDPVEDLADATFGSIKLIMYYLLSVSQNINAQNLIYGEENDLIVAHSSQGGGLEISSIVNVAGNQSHIGSTGNQNVLNLVDTYLNTSPDNTPFSTNGYNPEDLHWYGLASFGKTEEATPLTSVSVDITSPSYGTTFNSGENISIVVEGSPDVQTLVLSIGNEYEDVYNYYHQGSSNIFNIAIPLGIIDRMGVAVLAFDGMGNAAYDTLSVNISCNIPVDSIQASPNVMYVPLGHSLPLSVYGYFSDNVMRNLSNSDSLQFAFTTNNAVRENENYIKGLTLGNDTVTISYRNHSETVYISVIDASNWVTVPVDTGTSDPNSINPTKLPNDNIGIYPNPNNGSFTIMLNDTKPLGSVRIEVYSTIGELIKTETTYFNENRVVKQFNLNVARGIYTVRIVGENHCYSKKMIIH